jgi:hypothetical protein
LIEGAYNAEDMQLLCLAFEVFDLGRIRTKNKRSSELLVVELIVNLIKFYGSSKDIRPLYSNQRTRLSILLTLSTSAKEPQSHPLR